MSDKPTKGPWTTDEHEHDCPNQNIFVQAKGRSICKVWIGDACFDLNGEQRANARLIAEAGTVYHETGKTPRELEQQCKQLEEALLLALPELNGLALVSPYAKSLADKARAALSAAERKT